MFPKARSEQLIVKEMDGELAIYDEREHRAHELNATAAAVWQRCDGKTSLADIAARIAAHSELPQDEDIVRMALDQLSRAGLLDQATDVGAGVSRRQLIRRLGLAGPAVLLLPAVTTLVAPTRAMAQSPPAPTPGSPTPGSPTPTAPTPTAPTPASPTPSSPTPSSPTPPNP